MKVNRGNKKKLMVCLSFLFTLPLNISSINKNSIKMAYKILL